jgi:hypothetical protein
MATEETVIKDPLGNHIRLPKNLCDLEGKEVSPEIYDDADTAIKKPAFIIETMQEGRTELHYFRSIGWHHTLLLTVRKKDGEWVASTCILNPERKHLTYLLTQGKKIF